MRCPHCGSDERYLERYGGRWFCRVCARDWQVEEARGDGALRTTTRVEGDEHA